MKTDRDLAQNPYPRNHGPGRHFMSYISHLYSIYFAPRGNIRMAELGMQIAQQYLRPTDKLIGVIGDAGSGK